MGVKKHGLSKSNDAAEPRRTLYALAAIVFAATFAVFCTSLNAGFSGFDDHGVLLEADGWRGLTPSNLAWMFSFDSTRMGHYQPLTWVTYAIDYAFWELDPRGYHLTNVFFHGANAVLVFVLSLRLLTPARGASGGRQLSGMDRPVLVGALLAALLWSLHPLRVESVAWVTERRDVISGFFLLLTALAYLRAFPAGSLRPASPRAYWASAALLLASLLSKAWGMSFFVVALLLDVYPLRRLPAAPWRWLAPQFRPVLLQKAPYTALGALFAALAAHAQGSTAGTVHSLARWGIAERCVQACYGLMFYIWKTVLPTKLAALYELPVRISPWEPRFVAGYLALIGLGAAAVLFRRRAPALAAAAVVYLVIIAPVLGIFQSGIQLVADRYSYLSCIGWAVLVGAGASVLLRRFDGSLTWPALRTRWIPLASIAAAMLGALSVATWRQTQYWKDTEKLFLRVIELGYDGPQLRASYGRVLEVRARTITGGEQQALQRQALEQFDLAVAMEPDNGQLFFERGNMLRELGRFDEAEQSYLRAKEVMEDPWSAYMALGLMYLSQKNRPPDALKMFDACVKAVERPNRPRGSTPGEGGWPYLTYAAALDLTGNPRASREMLLKAAQYAPTHASALEHLVDVEVELREQK